MNAIFPRGSECVNKNFLAAGGVFDYMVSMKSQTEIWDSIIAEIRSRVDRKEINQAGVAKLLDVGTGTVTRWLKGDRGSSQKTLDELRRYIFALGLNPKDFFQENESPEKKENEFLFVPKANTQLGAGSSLIVNDGHNDDYAFRKEFIHSLGHRSTKKLVLFDVIGDSMEPLIYDGDTVLVEKAVGVKPKNGEIWAIWVGFEVLIKRVQAQPRGYLFTSENEKYRPLEVYGEQEDFGLIGRVRWLGRIF